MRPVSVWLERFRRPSGVPPAATDELGVELLSVFATLDEIEEEAARLREEAQREATRRLEAGAIRAERVLADSRARVKSERARAEAEQRASIAGEVSAVEVAAQAEAGRLRERGLERVPVLVDAVLACVTGEDG